MVSSAESGENYVHTAAFNLQEKSHSSSARVDIFPGSLNFLGQQQTYNLAFQCHTISMKMKCQVVFLKNACLHLEKAFPKTNGPEHGRI